MMSSSAAIWPRWKFWIATASSLVGTLCTILCRRSSALTRQSSTSRGNACPRNRRSTASGSWKSCGHRMDSRGWFWLRRFGIFFLELDVGDVLLGLVAQLEVSDNLLHQPRLRLDDALQPLLVLRRDARVLNRLHLRGGLFHVHADGLIEQQLVLLGYFLVGARGCRADRDTDLALKVIVQRFLEKFVIQSEERAFASKPHRSVHVGDKANQLDM